MRLTPTASDDEFRALAAEHRVVPVIRKVLADSETPLSAYRKLGANRPGTFLLESAENGRSWSRWSFIGAGAPSALTVRDDHAAAGGESSAGAQERREFEDAVAGRGSQDAWARPDGGHDPYAPQDHARG